MRLRIGWTQAQVAAAMGVRQSSIARWEQSEEWPDVERLALLCETLHAHPAETAALQQGRFSLGSCENEASVLDAVILRYGNFLFDWRHGDALLDLTFLSLQAQLWPVATSSAGASALLAEIVARHAHMLMEAERFTEAHRCLERVPVGQHPGMRIGETQHLTTIVQAQTAAKLSKGRRGLLNSVRLLEDWVGVAPYEPRCTPYAFSVMAELMMRAGDAEAALRTARKACRLVEQEDDLPEIAYRRRDLVSMLLRAGQSEEAAALMREVPPVSLRCGIVNAALWAEILLALGERTEAQSRLDEASHLLETRNLAHLRPRLEPAQELLLRE
jgi:transcriptional regulator with XRE-family HTH domain